MSVRPALAQAYASARYEIHFDHAAFTRRIGVVDQACDARLREAGCRRHWFIVTPCNPRSQHQDQAGNEVRLRTMAQQLREAGWSHVDSLASAEDGTWPEAGFCIFDLAEHEACALGRQYGQHAIVGGVLGSTPALIWLEAAAGG